MTFTPDQTRAITFDTETSGSAIVSAAAGSGKTAVLVERILRLLSDPEKNIPCHSLAVMTFTKKAAEELRARVAARLSERLEEAQGYARHHLQRQMTRLDDLAVSTISSFCLDLLREYSECLPLPQDFAVLDEAVCRQLRLKAADMALDDLYDPKHFSGEECTLLRSVTGQTGDDALSQALLAMHAEAEKKPDPAAYMERSLSLYGDRERFYAMLSEGFIGELRETAARAFSLSRENAAISASTRMAHKLAEEHDLAKAWYSFITEDIGALEKPNSPENKDKIATALALLERRCVHASYGKAFTPDEKAAIKANRDTYKPLLEKTIPESIGLLMSWQALIEAHPERVRVFYRLYRRFVTHYTALKREADGVDFADIEHGCLDLLRTSREALSAGFYEIIVDEFQDSNEVQYEIFRGLSRGGRNLFFVGDVKQSIYRFRSADPRVFRRVAESPDFTCLYLSRNFRSSNEVIAAVNAIFRRNMTVDVGGVDYDENNALVPGLDVAGEKAELVLLKAGQSGAASFGENAEQAAPTFPENPDENDDPAEQTAAELEAAYVAARIREMADGGFSFTDKNGEARPCRYGDFAVLLSALSTDEEAFLAAFERYGVPAVRGGSGDYLKVAEVGSFLSLLAVVDDPYDDLALLEVMMSPIYDFSAEEVAEVKLSCASPAPRPGESSAPHPGASSDIHPGASSAPGASPDPAASYNRAARQRPLYSGLRRCKLPKARALVRDLRRWKSLSENQPPVQLIRHILDEDVLLPLIAAAKSPEKAEANLRLLLYYAGTLGIDGTLAGLLRFVRSAEGGTMAEADALSGEDAVRLMTVHAAKGLEYPVCFVCRVNKTFNKKETHADIIFHEEIGMVMQHIDPASLVRYRTLPHAYAAHSIVEAATSEEMRKLYVAATRARNKLIFTAAVEEDKDGDEKIKENSWLAWLMMAAGEELVLQRKEGIAPPEFSPEKAEEESRVHEEAMLIAESFRRTYPFGALMGVRRKLTATEIGIQRAMHGENADEPTIYPRRPSFLGEKKLTGKRRGDAYHKAMEKLDFRAGEYAEQLKGLEPLFTPDEYRAVLPGDICGFFASPLGQRAVRSERVEKEYPLYTEIGLEELGFSAQEAEFLGEKPFVQGIADMFFYEAGEIVLVDYKTNRGKNAKWYVEEYREQLVIYKRAIEEMTGFVVRECWVYSFEQGAILLEI